MSRNYDSSSASSSTQPSSVGRASLDNEALDVKNQIKETENVELPAKKDAGKVGRPIQLRLNFYRVQIDQNVMVTHCDFNIKEVNCTLGKESVKKRDEKMAFFNAFVKDKLPQLRDIISYDGQANLYILHQKDLFGPNQNEGQQHNYQYASRGSRKRDFIVTIRKVAQYSSNEINKYLQGHSMELRQEAIQALDVVLRHNASQSYVSVGRNSFNPNQPNRKDIGSGREIWFGYHQSLRTIEGKSGGSLALNIDMCASAFMKEIRGDQLALEYFNPRNGEREMSDRRFFNDGRRKDLEKQMKGVHFRATHLKNQDRLWRCGSLSRNGAGSQTFTLENGRTVTIYDYFQKEHRIKLRFPDMPCIVVGNPKSGTAKYFPMELMQELVAPRQRSPGKPNEMMTANMIRACPDSAPQRERINNELAQDAIKNGMVTGRKFGMKIKNTMEEQNGRVLPAPQLEYGMKGNQRETCAPRDGAWDTRGKKFLVSGTCSKWIVINFNTRTHEKDVGRFCQELSKTAGFLGVKMPPPDKIFNCRAQQEVDQKLSLCKANGISLCLIIVPRRDTQMYSFVKSNAEIQYGVMTQCVQAKNVERCNGQLLGNLMQKINTKLGGTNTRISLGGKVNFFKRPAMVVGISMTHPDPGSDKPTIVSAVFSCDSNVNKYVAEHRLQRSKFGIVSDLKSIMIAGLKQFYKSTQKKPERIVVYRGGGSEGELQQIAKYEVNAIKEAFAALSKGSTYSPGLTYIVLNKKTHTRYFAANQKDQIGKSGNVPAGTIVDTNVVSKSMCDFYLTSAQGIKGTSRPGHYMLVHDDNDLSADSLQVMTWHLCHGYARCTRSVGIPCPVYYAQLNAERVSRYLNDHLNSDCGSSISGKSDNAADEDISRLGQLTVVSKDLVDVQTKIPTMYFV